MENKILKLIKMFETFTIGELSNILECDKKEILPYIDKFMGNNTILKTQNNKYTYIPPIKKTKPSSNRKIDKIFNAEYLSTITNYKQINPKILFYNEEDIIFYKQAFTYTKERIVKYLQIFDKTYNMNLEEVEIFLKNIKEKYPALRFKMSTTIKLRDNFMKLGLRAFETKAIHQKNYIPDDVYLAFKKLYLHSTQYTIFGAYKELANMGFDTKLIPCYSTFKNRLKSDYSNEKIEMLRTKNCITPILNDPSFRILNEYKENTISTKLFKNTALEFLENIPNKTTAKYKRKKACIYTHLMPFFGDLAWNDITRNKLVEFIEYKIKSNYKNETIRGLLFVLFQIKRLHVDDSTEIIREYLSIDEIKSLYNNIPKLWVISTGFTESELLGLRYEDINYDEQTITLKYIYKDGTLHKLARSTLHKKIYIPSFLFEKLSKNKTGRIFEKVEIENYEILINTFVDLCLQKNVPFLAIAKQLGYETVRLFYNDYKQLIPKEIKVDLLEGII